jgi:cation transport ATPase
MLVTTTWPMPATPGTSSYSGDASEGQSVVNLVVDQQPVASLALADLIRPESREAVQRLHALGPTGGHADR